MRIGNAVYDRDMRRHRRRALLAILVSGAIAVAACGGGKRERVRQRGAPSQRVPRVAHAGRPDRTDRRGGSDAGCHGASADAPSLTSRRFRRWSGGPGARRHRHRHHRSWCPALPRWQPRGIEECTNPCISPLHTHDETGIIHTEAAADTLLTLGQLFTEWGVRLDEECVGEFCESETDIAVHIDGDEYEGDPTDIELDDQLVIAIVIGTPPDRIPETADFSQA